MLTRCNAGLSVIMGTLYRSHDTALLRRSVESVLNQTFDDFEFIICDTGSSVEATTYLESLADSRIKLVRRDGCLDLASKLNACLDVAKGQYIARMDDDDFSHSERFEKEVAFLESNNFDFVGCNVALIQNGKEVGQRILPEKPTVRDFYLTQPYIHPALIFRKDALDAVGGYSESETCRLCEDYDLLLRLYKDGFVGANLQEVLLDYTIPLTTKGNRTMHYRMNEVKTRFRRFKELGKLPRALPYVVKPIITGLLPEKVLARAKRRLICQEDNAQKSS